MPPRKRLSPITSSLRAPRGLKPQAARLWIRRYHVLQRHRARIFGILEGTFPGIAEENYLKLIRKTALWKNYEGDGMSSEDGVNAVGAGIGADGEPIITLGVTPASLVITLGQIDREVAARGGMAAYQAALTVGQGSARGGDSSKVLMEWLREGVAGETWQHGAKSAAGATDSPTALEIGSLSVKNEISQARFFANVTRIDLKSGGVGIEEQDFMERPLPRKSAGNAERFDLISCSLVLNFVPGAVQRGEMLKRFSKFFKNASTGGAGNAKRSATSSGGEAKRAKNGPSTDGRDTAKREHGEDSLEAEVKEDSTRVPLLFVVLPLPCVTNSRYCTEELFLEIMASLGYVVRAQRAAVKVGYWLFEWCGTNGDIRLKGKTRTTFPKKELVAGGKRNNFCIVLE